MRPSVFYTGGHFFILLYIIEIKTHIRRKKCVHKETNIAKMKIALVIHVHAQQKNVVVMNMIQMEK
jgi:hypothetical protein